ncbi:MAG TPA: 23S rRNA (pseudouridine(1915)-N(3))-methyltransferase RlmH [Polyangia bacterium]|jgi:23S rRNA (pseudouridine1915-N3)-methyltransferase
MRLLVLCVGKVRERPLRESVAEYLDRLQHYLPTELCELRDAEAALARVPERYLLCALDEHGAEWTSVELKRFVEGEMNHGRAGIAFLIGGAEGLPAPVLARAARKLSLSRLTLPHRLARLVLVEQLYRVATMIRGEPYHKE